MADIPTTNKSVFALHVAMVNLLDSVNSAGVKEIVLWRTRSEDFAPEMAKSFLNQGETNPDVWYHRSRRAPR